MPAVERGGIAASNEIARILVREQAITFRTNPFFTFTSGTQSPIYIDNRRLLGSVVSRRVIIDCLADALNDLQFEAVVGTASAGIPWGAWIAERWSLPFLYVRSSAKEWGQARVIEGSAPEGSRVLLVEDLIFSAGSVVGAVHHLRQAGYDVDHCAAIVTYDTNVAALALTEAAVSPHVLTTVDQALNVAGDDCLLAGDQIKIVSGWLARHRQQRNDDITGSR